MEEEEAIMASSGPTEQDFQCSCCYELMVDPTTLNCGHSFCRLCLARWWISSKNTTCPECRQPWQGFPSVNIILRKTIHSLFPIEISQRQHSILQNNSDYQRIMSRFEAYGKKISKRRSGLAPDNQGNMWLKTVGFMFSAVGITLLIYELLSLTSSPGNVSLMTNHIINWTPQNVSEWVGSLGSWAKGDYDVRFFEAGIDGRALVTLTESDLQEPPFSINVSYHRKVILNGLETLKIGTHEVKPPADFWEYKAMYPVDSIFYLVGLREFPRATIIYMFLFDYEALFYPLLKHASEPDNASTDAGIFKEGVSTMDYVRFFVQVILVPYYVIGQFAFSWMHLNQWVASVVIIYCALMTLAEGTKLKWLLLGGWRQLPGIIATSTNQAVLNGMLHMVLWRVMPSFVCDTVFYWMLFLSPIAAWKSLKAGVLNAEGENQTMRVFFSWVWRNARGPMINFHARNN